MFRFFWSDRLLRPLFFLLLFVAFPGESFAQLTASFAGLGGDVVGNTAPSPDGSPDFKIFLGGLRGTPTLITVTNNDGPGIWQNPYNGTNWMVFLTNQSGATGELYFSQYPVSSFHVVVRYEDGSTDQADASSTPVPSTLGVAFAGLGADLVSPYALAPDGQADYRLSLSGLRSAPITVTVTSDSHGIWRIPFNGANWLVLVTNQTASTADIYLSEYSSSVFHVIVQYSDGTSDQADSVSASPPPSTLTGVFRGLGADNVSQLVPVPDGQPDYRITLGGLRDLPTKITVTAETGGIWSTPYNGSNWIVQLLNRNGANADIYFSQYPGQNFHVEVWYPDGSSDAADSIYQPGAPEADAVRLLAQATFGPTPALIAQVQESGVESYVDQQANAPMRDYPDLAFWPTTRPSTCIDACQRDNYTYYQLWTHFYSNGLSGEDQLRQRVAFALSEILVTSFADVPYPAWMRSYQQMLYRSAFGNYRQLLFDVTLHPTMGRFLDMMGSRCKPTTDLNVCRNQVAGTPNENYAREVLQLFSIGTYVLDQSGNRVLDAGGNPIPTYDQHLIEEFSRAFTGWVIAANIPGPPELPGTTVPNYRDPMRVFLDGSLREAYHDRGAKTLLNGVTLAPGRTALQDLNDAIDNIAFHPNVAPFLSKQLIQRLVTSNPSPDYVRRIAEVWTLSRNAPDQLFLVVRAILLDPEARNGHTDPTLGPGYGKLREPALFITSVLRSLGGASDGVLNNLTIGGSPIGSLQMSQDIFNAPSVFNYFPPTARVPGETALGPEFAIFSSLTSLRRDNLVYRLVFLNIPAAPPDRPLGTFIDLSSWEPLAATPDSLLTKLDTLLLNGSMSAEMRQRIRTAVEAISSADPRGRVRMAIYLILTSSQYQVQR